DVVALCASGLVMEATLLVLAPSPDYRYSHWLVVSVCIATAILVARRAAARAPRAPHARHSPQAPQARGSEGRSTRAADSRGAGTDADARSSTVASTPTGASTGLSSPNPSLRRTT